MSSSHAVGGARNDGPPPLVSRFARALEDYQRSDRTFQVLSTIRPDSSLEAQAPPVPPEAILVLDSSFNPPTLAHKRMALSALFEDGRADGSSSSGGSSSGSKGRKARILLLLAINNADKAPKPAAFPQRLAMMQIFGAELLSDVIAAAGRHGDDGRYGCAGVDVAVTTEPYFHAKAAAVAASDFYRGGAPAEGSGEKEEEAPPPEPEQVYLTGFDTLIRIFDPKYYANNAMARALDPFFARARLRVTTRTDADWGDAAAQGAYLEQLRRGGGLERVGGRAGWADRIEMVEGRKDGSEEVVSSTKVREAVLRRDWEALRKLVSGDVAGWIREQGLYAEVSV
ncbi:Nucleotidylyl transferase [Hypoxylon rubiginosum]|uniref:Nucleotidylyl transferase n=1 Tax=Hypoxylon rubiginosum TaxID=110542 RepID=A0ACB9YZ66_9PEZI|nr:Nucleotidylyl transferase [Hypoxylon rubiginosum]